MRPSACRLTLGLGAAWLAASACGPPPPATVQLLVRVLGDEWRDPLKNLGTAERPGSDVELLSLSAGNSQTGEEHTLELPSDLGVSDRQVLGALPIAAGAGWQVTLSGKDRFGFLWALGRSRPFEVPARGSAQVPLMLGIADDFAASGRVEGGLGPFASASLLPDGSVLLVGLGGVFVHEPQAGRVCGEDCLSGERPAPRWLHAAVTLPDGRVFVAGGASASGLLLDDAYLFDGSSRQFLRLRVPGLLPRAGAASVALRNGRVLQVGGLDTAAQPSARAVLIDLSAFVAAEAPPFPGGVSLPAAAMLESGEVLVCGGLGPAGEPSGAAMVYSADGTSARRAADLNSPRGAHSAAPLSDGRVVIFGGLGDGERTLAAPEAFIPTAGASGEFVAVEDTHSRQPLEPRAGHAAVRLESGEVLIVGGENEPLGTPDPGRPGTALKFSPTGEIGDVYHGSFERVGLIPARAGVAAVALPDASVLVAGGARGQRGASFPPREPADWAVGLEVFVRSSARP
ncbi:MAG: hypothetical protein HYZ28_02465 [Myxococcales bacterium]|nr:hypothetical protein [Myxococcales bacterium]